MFHLSEMFSFIKPDNLIKMSHEQLDESVSKFCDQRLSN